MIHPSLYTVQSGILTNCTSKQPSRGGSSKGHRCEHEHPIVFAKQSKLVDIIHEYKLVIRSDPNTDSKLGSECSVLHSRKGRPKGVGVPGGARRR